MQRLRILMLLVGPLFLTGCGASWSEPETSKSATAMHNEEWPFDQAENVAAITTRQVIEDGMPILMVIHYSDDHSCAFLCGTTGDADDGRLIFREIEPDDLEAIFDVRIATRHNEHGREELARMGITYNSVRQMLADCHRGWLCETDGRAEGFAMGNRTTGELWVIAVRKAHEGKRIGRQLLTRVEDWLREAGWQEIWLTTDTDESLRAVGFYRHLGWEDWKIEDGDRFMKKHLM